MNIYQAACSEHWFARLEWFSTFIFVGLLLSPCSSSVCFHEHLLFIVLLLLTSVIPSLFCYNNDLCGLDEKIALLGAIQSLFEGSMYTFVFLWTPALSPNEEDIPHGFIFATFMLASMLGSSIASRLMAHSSPKVESYMQVVFVVSAASLLLPIVTTVCNQLILITSHS